MKKHYLVLTLLAGAALTIAGAENPSPSPSVAPSPSATPDGGGTRCEQQSSIVEVHSFYGNKKIVTEKLADMPGNLSERRVFLQVTQSARKDGAMTMTEVKEFEQKDGSFKITQWTKVTAPDLLDKLDHAIIKSKGEKCVGKAMEDVLKTLGTGELLTPPRAPSSYKDAFGPSVQDASGEFIKTVVIFGC